MAGRLSWKASRHRNLKPFNKYDEGGNDGEEGLTK